MSSDFNLVPIISNTLRLKWSNRHQILEEKNKAGYFREVDNRANRRLLFFSYIRDYVSLEIASLNKPEKLAVKKYRLKKKISDDFY